MSATPSAAAVSATITYAPLTIHACNGRFLVWEAAVCRTLALEYRIIGEFARNSKQIVASTSNSDSTKQETTDDTEGEGANQISNETFVVESLPMSLEAWQVLFLFEHAAAALDLRDGSSLNSLRAATIGTNPSAIIRASLKDRLLEFQREMKVLAEHTEKMRQKFQRKPSPTNDLQTSVEDPADAEARPMKRVKVEESNAMASIETPLITASNPMVESLLDSLMASGSGLPLGSSLGLANAAQSLDASTTAATSHPANVALIARPSATIDRKVLVLDMKFRNTYKSAEYQRPTLPQTEALLLRAICESLGLPVDNASVRHTSFLAFLSLYSCFVHQWQQGYFVLPGLHFGCDLVCYEDFPSQVHSTYLVRVMNASSEGQHESVGLPLLELANLGRMATSVNKAVLLMQCTLGKQVDPAPATPTDTFRAALELFGSCRIDCSTCVWSFQPQLALQSFSKQHLITPLKLRVK